MALMECKFYSDSIGINTSMNVIYPKKAIGKVPTLYLLHGYTDDYSIWCRRTNIEVFAEKYNLAIVMPDVAKSFYCNFHNIEVGYKYWDFVSQELITMTRQMFNLSNKREDTFVAGLSMGGFGAFKLALNHPEIFSAAASLSGVVDLSVLSENHIENEVKMLVGNMDLAMNSINNLNTVSTKLNAKNIPKPKLYQCCGTEDFLYDVNLKFKSHMEKLNFDYSYFESKGVHDWVFWNEYIEKVLEWLPIRANN